MDCIKLMVLTLAFAFKPAHSQNYTEELVLTIQSDQSVPFSVGESSFNSKFWNSSHILKRVCSNCAETHRLIYYKRITNVTTFDMYYNTYNTWSSTNNLLNIDFKLYSSWHDLVNDENAWTHCNYDDSGIGSFRDCGPSGLVPVQWTSTSRAGGKTASHYILTMEPTTYDQSQNYELILNQKDVRIARFSSNSETTFLENEDDPTANTFTNIGNLNPSDFVDNNGYYHFKLIYTNLHDYEEADKSVDNNLTVTLEWAQTSWLTETLITGFTPINVPNETNFEFGVASDFDGLGLSLGSAAILDGDGYATAGNWWNAVGVSRLNYGGILAFNEQIAMTAALYIYRGYELILSHKNARDGSFNSDVRNTYLENEDNSTANTFTNIGNLNPSDFEDDAGYYRFKLIYTNLHDYDESNKTDNDESVTLEWKQTSWLTAAIITGYTPINAPNQTSFEGLGLSAVDDGLLDGDAQGIPAFDEQAAFTAALYVYRPRSYDGIDFGSLNNGLIIRGDYSGFYNADIVNTVLGTFSISRSFSIEYEISAFRGWHSPTEIWYIQNDAGIEPLSLWSNRISANFSGDTNTLYCGGSGSYRIEIDRNSLVMYQNGEECATYLFLKEIIPLNLINTTFNFYYGSDGSAFLRDISIQPLTTGAPNECEYGEDYFIYGQPCIVWGDPHTTMFNGDTHDFQGQPSVSINGTLKNQFYYIQVCNGSDHEDMPFSILGTHYRWQGRSVSGLDYIVIELYDDNGDEYAVFFSANLHSYALNPTTTSYDDIPSADLTNLTSGTSTSIGNRFEILYIQTSATRIDVTLTIDEECEITFFMSGYVYFFDGRWRMHEFQINPPECYECFTCGLCGDFQQGSSGSYVRPLQTCHGEYTSIRPGWTSAITEAYDVNGLSWEKQYFDNNCDPQKQIETNEPYEPEECEEAECEYVPICEDEEIEIQVNEACEAAKVNITDCCDQIESLCNDFLETCKVDVLGAVCDDISVLDEMVNTFFTDPVLAACNNTLFNESRIITAAGAPTFAPTQPTEEPTAAPTEEATAVGCADGATEIEVITDAIYACPGTIASGGTYGEDAANLCNAGYSVCESAIRAAELGLNVDICTDNSIFTNVNQFFATKETSYGYGQCGSQYGNPENKRNDVWGCANSEIIAGISMDKNVPCSVNGSVIFRYDIGERDWNNWKLLGNGLNEAETYSLTNSSSGGVLCCNDETPTSAPTTEPTTATPTTAQPTSSPTYAAGTLVFVNTTMTADDAQTYCESEYGGNLVSIHSAEQNAIINNLCVNQGQTQGACWLGMSNRVTPTQWFDGTPIDYTSWYVGEPDAAGSQNCVVFRQGLWFTVGYCDTDPLPFVCECQPFEISATILNTLGVSYGSIPISSDMHFTFSLYLFRGAFGEETFFTLQNENGSIPIKLNGGAVGRPADMRLYLDFQGETAIIVCDLPAGFGTDTKLIYDIDIDGKTVTMSRDGVECGSHTFLNDIIDEETMGTDFDLFWGGFNDGWIEDIVITSENPCERIAPTTSEPTSPPTIEPTACGDDDIGTFNWDTLTEDGVDIPYFNVSEFSVDSSDLSLNILVELEYLGSVTADNEDEANFGVTYVLDFEDYDAHKDAINEPGTCQNRNESAFDGKSFSDYWTYSTQPHLDGNIGTSDYLSYPPPDPVSGSWDVYMKDGQECNTVIYEGKFTWNELRGCEANGGGDSYTSVVSDDKWLNLTGTFYINVVSPFWYSSDFGYYRVYQLLSQPFVIAVSSTVYVLGSTGINLMTLSVVAVYKEDDASDFKLVLMTESADYMMLERSNSSIFFFDPSDDNDNNFDNTDFIASTDPENSEGCLSNKDFICTQLWQIDASNIGCTVGAGGEGTDFSGTYSLGFNAVCIDDAEDSHCSQWIESHPDLQGEISLSTQLFWKDDICDPEVFTVQFVANMIFYSDEYQVIAGNDHLYQVGEDRIYVEIETEFPSETLEIFNTQLINVWICTFSPDISPSIDMDNLLSSGCLSSSRDSDYDVYFYNIYYSGDAENAQSGFTVDNDNEDDETDIVRFSFDVPNEVARDTLYVHAQIEVELTELEGVRRRMLLNVGVDSEANQIQHFGEEIGIKRTSQSPNDNIYEYRPQEQPQQPQPQLPVSPQPSTWTINLASPWIIGIGAVLSLLLCGNIVFLCYTNFKPSSSFQRRRNGYSSVKPIDSECGDSEAPMIKNQYQ